MTIISTLRKNPRVKHVDDERAIGNGVIITLREGWTFTPGIDNRVAGEDTATQARALVASAKPFAGPYDTIHDPPNSRPIRHSRRVVARK